jgi:hypothetical protein
MTTSSSSRAVELGSGMLNWNRYERVGDRYGAVSLFGDRAGEPDLDDYLAGGYPGATTAFAEAPVGSRGQLRAEVLVNRRSGHIGDLFRGLRPPDVPPAPGTILTLGTGTLFVEHDDGVAAVGLRPDDGRASDWLDPEVLYQLHEQTVRLVFVPDGAERGDR